MSTRIPSKRKMAPDLPAPDLPAPPDVSPPHQPSPVPTPGPATTSHHATASTDPSPPETSAPILTPTSSAEASPCDILGRSKSQRWTDSSPDSPDGDQSILAAGNRPSFCDVVLHPRSSPGAISRSPSPRILAEQSSSGATATQPSSSVPSPLEIAVQSPHISPGYKHRWFRGLERAPKKDADGWVKVRSKKTRQRSAKLLRASKAVPVDLIGRCFNCFADDHFAVSCRREPRCFRCKALGHRSYTCPGPVRNDNRLTVHRRLSRGSVWDRLGSAAPAAGVQTAVKTTSVTKPSQQASKASVWNRLRIPAFHPSRFEGRNKVWRRISPPSAEGEKRKETVSTTVATSSTVMEVATAAHSQQPLPPRPRRRRHRKRRSSSRGGSDPGQGQDGAVLPGSDETPLEGIAVQSHVPCIIGWNNLLTQAEDDLKNAVSIVVISDLVIPIAEIAEAIALKLDAEASSLVLRQFTKANLLLMLPNERLALVLTERWSLIRSSTFSLLSKKWSKFLGSSGVSLPIPVEVQLTGIPLHAWELSTVQQLLNQCVWVHEVHPDTLELRNLDVFRCSGWCFDPATIPASRDLWIVEPTGVNTEDGRLGLVYQISISFSTLRSDRLIPSQDSGVDGGFSRQRRRHRSRSPPHGGDDNEGREDGGEPRRRRSIFDRLGSKSEASHRDRGGTCPPHLSSSPAVDVVVSQTPSEAGGE